MTLGWDSSSDPNVLGYNIYYGTASHQYLHKVTAVNGTTVTIAGLIEGVTYYFAATTYGAFNQESDFSEEAIYTVPYESGNEPGTSHFVAGQTVTFTTAATGTGSLRYQWQLDYADLPAATNAVLTLDHLTVDQAGLYTVTVFDEAGSLTNLAAQVMVHSTAAATLTEPVYDGGQYAFTVSGVPDFEYVVQTSTNLTDWVSVATNVAPFDYSDTAADQFAQQFYRAFATFSSTPVSNGAAGSYAAGPLPPATLSSPVYAAGQYSFQITGDTGYEYVVEASTDLTHWLPVQTNTAPFVFKDVDAGAYAQRFYRARSIGRLTANLSVSANTTAVLSQPAYGNGQYSFKVSGVADYSYVVQASTNLVDWVSVQTNTAPFTFVDPDADQFPQRFYRVF